MDPGMDADLMAVFGDAAHLLFVQQGRNGWIEEGHRNGFALHQRPQARHALAIAILPLADAHRARIGVAQRDRLVIGVEGERHGAARPIGPPLRPQAPPPAGPSDAASPYRLARWPSSPLLADACGVPI